MSLRHPILALCVSFAILGTASAEEVKQQIYECNKGGQVVFSDEPCGPDAEAKTLDYVEPSAADAEAATRRAEKGESVASSIAEAQLLDTEILNTREEMDRTQAEYEAARHALFEGRVRGTEQTDLHAWQAEMTARHERLDSDYGERMETLNARLSDLQARRAAIGQSSADPSQP